MIFSSRCRCAAPGNRDSARRKLQFVSMRQDSSSFLLRLNQAYNDGKFASDQTTSNIPDGMRNKTRRGNSTSGAFIHNDIAGVTAYHLNGKRYRARMSPMPTLAKKLLLSSIAALSLVTGTAQAAGVDYVCGDHYSIIVEPKDRTIKTYGRMDVDSDGVHQTETTEFVPKGIMIFNDKTSQKWTVKTLPRNTKGKVAVRGISCKKINQGS